MNYCFILFALLLLNLAEASRRSALTQPTPTTTTGIHRMGWGLDEEYIEPNEEEMEDYYATVKPVKREVTTTTTTTKQELQDKGNKCRHRLWGVSCVSDLDDLMDE